MAMITNAMIILTLFECIEELLDFPERPFLDRLLYQLHVLRRYPFYEQVMNILLFHELRELQIHDRNVFQMA